MVTTTEATTTETTTPAVTTTEAIRLRETTTPALAATIQTAATTAVAVRAVPHPVLQAAQPTVLVPHQALHIPHRRDICLRAVGDVL